MVYEGVVLFSLVVSLQALLAFEVDDRLAAMAGKGRSA